MRAVIFDMYETLVTQLDGPLYYGAQIAGDLGLDPAEFLPQWRKTEADRATGKDTFEAVIARLMDHFGIPDARKLQQVVQTRLAIQRRCFSQLHPQILPMLSLLRARGLKLGLITNCFSEEAALIRESELFAFFDAPCLSYELGIRKPDPAIFRECLARLALAPEDCLYVGDGGSRELETARALGMQALQATWYRRPGMDNYQAALRPDVPHLEEPEQLLSFLP